MNEKSKCMIQYGDFYYNKSKALIILLFSKPNNQYI